MKIIQVCENLKNNRNQFKNQKKKFWLEITFRINKKINE